ncbi:MAG: hypothetical protein GXY13_10330 [Acidimicrobiales bacterium]|nr:hypothetical protein [Acidimicrobiales bacterium]
MSLRRLLTIAVVAVLVLGTAACGGDDGGDEAEGADRTTESDEAGELGPVPDAIDSLTEPPVGQGVAVIGVEELSFVVDACERGPEPGDTPEATLEFRLTGSGEMSGATFTVDVSRYRSDTGQGTPVVTETATIAIEADDGPRGITARRTTAGTGGTWQDLTDPDVDEPLIDQLGEAIDVRATFGPEGARVGDDGLEQGRIRAHCPAP